jgi:hypothetical protein
MTEPVMDFLREKLLGALPVRMDEPRRDGGRGSAGKV